MDLKKLTIAMVNNDMNLTKLAVALNMPKSSLSKRVNGKTNFSYNDLISIKNVLKLNDFDFMEIFFK